MSLPVRREHGLAAAREFVLIVLGVLVALWVNDWNQARQDRHRERTDLRQLLVTTQENERRIEAAIADDSSALLSSRKLLDALSRQGALPPADSLSAWRSGALRFSEFFPLTGTYTALAQTGDLNLIRDDSLRARVATYSGELEGAMQQLRDWTEAFHRNVEELVRLIPVQLVVEAYTGRNSGGAGWRDPVIVRAFYMQQIGAMNRLKELRRLQGETRALLHALQSELHEGGPPSGE